MPTRLDWRVGPAGQPPATIDVLLDDADDPTGEPGRGDGASARATRPATQRAAQRAAPRRRVRWPVFALLYLLILGTAAVIGFGLGRWSELYGGTRSRIENQLAIEALAWRDADAGLLASTLDPQAPPEWRQAEIERFRALAPLPFRAEVHAIDLVTPGLARVRVAVAFPTGDEEQTRHYRWVDGVWVRTPGP